MPREETRERCGGSREVNAGPTNMVFPCPGCPDCDPAPPDPQGQVEKRIARMDEAATAATAHAKSAADKLRAFASDERLIVWICEKGHVDDHHGSVEGLEERCSRCGGSTTAHSLASLVQQLDQAERRVEEAKADASEANHQANMMSRNLQAADAFAASYRQGLEQIVAVHARTNVKVCDCSICVTARDLLNPSSTSEGDA